MKGSISLYVWHGKLRYDEVVHIPGATSLEDAFLFACSKFHADPFASKVQLELGSLILGPITRDEAM